MSLFLAPESWPFTLAAVLLVAIVAIEGAALLAGLSLSGWIDNLMPEADLAGMSDSWLGWLHLGKVPILVLFIVLLTAFSLLGLALVALIHALLGLYPPPLLSAPIALLGALPVVRVVGAAAGRLIPRDETSAESLESLVGRVAVVISGTARMNYPAEARVRNDHGLTLYVRVEPDAQDIQFGPGKSVLLVKQISGSRFAAIANPRPDLL